MTEAAPWWGVPVIAGGFLILGGVLGFVSAYLSDRRKFKREDSMRYLNRLADLAAEVVALGQQMRERRPRINASDEEQAEGFRQVDQLMGEALRAAAVIRLLTHDPQLGSATEAYVSAQWAFATESIDAGKAADHKELGRLRREWFEREQEFMSVAHRALAVPVAGRRIGSRFR